MCVLRKIMILKKKKKTMQTYFELLRLTLNHPEAKTLSLATSRLHHPCDQGY